MKSILRLVNKIIILTLFLIGFYFIVTSSSHVRYWADDFCSSVTLRSNGFLNAQIFWWQGWTGRFSATFFTSLVELFNANLVTILSVILFILFLYSFYITYGFSIAALLTVLFLSNSPNIIQVFYWMTGSINYFVEFIFLNIFIYLSFKSKYVWSKYVSFLISFVAVGFSESFGLFYLIFISFLYLIARFTNEKFVSLRRDVVMYGFCGALMAFVIMLFSPGNEARSLTVSHPSGLFDLVSKTYWYGKWYLSHLFFIKTFLLSTGIILMLPWVYIKGKSKIFTEPKKVLVISLIFVLTITIAIVGSSFYAINWEPPERVMNTVNFGVLYALIVLSVSLRQIVGEIRYKVLPNLLFTLLLFGFMFQLSLNWSGVRQELFKYSTEWDKVDKILVDSNQSVVEINNIPPVGKLDGFIENKGWVLKCISAYYDVEEIIVKP